MKLKSYYLITFVIIIFLTSSVLSTFFYFKEKKENIYCRDCNIILISIDTLRADHLGIYGYERNTTPNIDNFFRDAFVFSNAFSQAPNTLPSHMSIFTGLYPSNHKLLLLHENETLSNQHKTIAEILKLYGYRTFGFYTGDYLSPRYGFSRGFDEYSAYDFFDNKSKLFDLLELAKGKNEKFFLFLHNDYVHDPYLAYHPYDTAFDSNYSGRIIGNIEDFYNSPQIKNLDNHSEIRSFYWSFVNKSDQRDINHLIALYDGSINMVDSFFGNFFNYLDHLNLLNNTIVILTADHGEEFGEHGGFLHEKLYDETIHIPLLVYIPNSKTNSETNAITDQVRSIDILPTLLSVVGIEAPQGIDGRSLKFLMKNPAATDNDQTLFTEFSFERAVRTPEWKLIKTMNGSVIYEFFNLKNDSGEKINLHGKGLEKETEFRNLLESWEIKMNSSYVNVEFLNSTFIGYP